jgi:hypothetical protein
MTNKEKILTAALIIVSFIALYFAFSKREVEVVFSKPVYNYGQPRDTQPWENK